MALCGCFGARQACSSNDEAHSPKGGATKLPAGAKIPCADPRGLSGGDQHRRVVATSAKQRARGATSLPLASSQSALDPSCVNAGRTNDMKGYTPLSGTSVSVLCPAFQASIYSNKTPAVSWVKA